MLLLVLHRFYKGQTDNHTELHYVSRYKYTCSVHVRRYVHNMYIYVRTCMSKSNNLPIHVYSSLMYIQL